METVDKQEKDLCLLSLARVGESPWGRKVLEQRERLEGSDLALLAVSLQGSLDFIATVSKGREEIEAWAGNVAVCQCRTLQWIY